MKKDLKGYLIKQNHKLMEELIQAMSDHDDIQIDVIHELMMTNKELILRQESMENQ